MREKVYNTLMYLCIVVGVVCLAVFLGVSNPTVHMWMPVGMLVAVIGGAWAYAKRG